MDDVLYDKLVGLGQLLTECLEEKNNPQDTKLDVEERIKFGALSFVVIKNINRRVKYKLREGRDALQEQKKVVDGNLLHLQNLLYEVNYLRREINTCYKFKSEDEDIDIYDTSEGEGPVEAHLSHKDRVSRLEKEIKLRKQLSDDCDKLMDEKANVCKDIMAQLDNLSTFAPSLKMLLKSTRPLQEALQLPIEQKWKLEHKVHMLPLNLYLTYVNLRAIEMLEKNIQVNVLGNVDEVSDFETRISEAKNEQIERTFLMKPHPLWLQLKLKDEEHPEDFVTVDIYYLPVLMIATAHGEIHIKDDITNMSETNLLQDFLQFINEDDMGISLPYSECSLNLQKHVLTLEEFQNYVTNNSLGKPYLWLQKIIGNSSFNNIRCNEMQTQNLKDFTLECVNRIRNFLQTRIKIIFQIRCFMNKNLDQYMNDMPNKTKPNCTLVQWSAITWEEYQTCTTTAPFIASQLVNETGSFFRAVIVHRSAKLECLICISNKYPLNMPLWTMTVYWNGHHNALNNSSIKVMEHYTNTLNDANQDSHKLADQLLRTMYSFDIYLETEGPLYQPVEYTKEKSFMKSFSKRLRMRPFKLIKKGSINYFKQ